MALSKTDFESRLLELAFKTDAVLAPSVVAYHLDISIEESTSQLENMATQGMLTMDYDDNGNILFKLPYRSAPSREPLSWKEPPPRANKAVVLARAAEMPRPLVRYVGEKNVGLAVGLAFLFGPLGMLYSTISGAFMMFLLHLLAVLTGGIGLLFTVPVSMIWAGKAAQQHNDALRAQHPSAQLGPDISLP